MSIMLVVVCRQYLPGTADDLVPGNILGHSCAICGRALQVRPPALQHIEAGSSPLCNPCGFAFVEYVKARKNLQPEDVKVITPSEDACAAIAELRRRIKMETP